MTYLKAPFWQSASTDNWTILAICQYGQLDSHTKSYERTGQSLDTDYDNGLLGTGQSERKG